MKIEGIDGLTAEQVLREVERGGRFVYFQYCISALVITFRRNSPAYFIRPGESATGKGLSWTLLTLALGWWGFPWGLIWTPMALYTNLRGGKDITAQLMPSLLPTNPSQAPQSADSTVWPPPPRV